METTKTTTVAPLIEHEQRWLPQLAQRVPLTVPVPLRVGRPGCGYSWSWSVLPWLPGENALVAPPRDPEETAVALGQFLRALHQPAPHDALAGVPGGGRVRQAELSAKQESGRSDSSRRLPSSRSSYRESHMTF